MKIDIKRNNRAGYNYNNQPVEYETSTYTPTQRKKLIEQRKKENAGIWDSFIEKIGETKSSSYLGDAMKNKNELDAIDKIKEYSDLCKKITTAKNELNNALSSNYSKQEISRALENINKLNEEKKQYDDYFLSNEGRQSRVISEVMYNSPGLKNKLKYVSDDFTSALDNALNTSPESFTDFVWGGIKKLFNVASGLIDIPVKTATGAYGEIKDVFGSDDGAKFDILASINDQEDVKQLYRGYDDYFTGKGENKYNNNFDISYYDKYLSSKKSDSENEIKDNINSYNYYNYLYKEGKIGGENGIKIARPEELSESFRKAQEEGVGWNPNTWKYVIPEMGSTISMYQHTLKQMGVDAAIRAAISVGEYYLIGGTMKTAKSLLEAGKTEEYAALMSKLPSNVQNAKRLRNTLNTVDVAQSLYFTRQSRIDETNSEASEAYTERVKQMSGWNQMDDDKKSAILKTIDNKLNSFGIDTSKLNENDKISAAISYGIKVGDKGFDDSQQEARKGLMKLINSNNSLAYLDFLEILPYMNYGSAIMEKASSSLAKNFAKNTIEDVTDRFVGSEARKASKKIIDDAVENYIRTKMYQASGKEVTKDLSKILSSLNAKTLKEYGKIWAKSIPLTMLEEGVEEGVQYKLGEAYKRGEYDNYAGAEEAISLPEVLFDLDMSTNSIADFIGLNPGSPEEGSSEIRKAMIIGGLSGALFSASMSHVQDIVGRGPISEAIKQTRANAAVAKLASEQFGKANDSEHIGIFFDSFKKVGVSPRRLEKALMNLRSYIPEINQDPNGPTTDFVDKDIQLMAATYNIYNGGKMYDDLIKELGIKKGSDDHKTFVTQAVQSVFDVNNSMRVMKEQNEALQEKRNTITQILSDLISNVISNPQFNWERVSEEQKKYKPLVETILKIRKNQFLSGNIVESDDFKQFVDKYNEQNGFNFTVQEAAQYENIRKEFQNQGLNDSEKFKKFVEEYNSKNYTNFTAEEASQYSAIRNEYLKSSQFNDKSIDTIIDNIFEYYQNRITDKIKTMLQNKSERLKDIRKLTGLDIYTDGLDGIITSFEDLQKANKANNKEFYGNTKLMSFIGNILQDANTQSIFENLDDSIYKAMLTYGLHEAKRVIAAAYNPKLTLNPIKAKRIIFGESDATSNFKKVLDEYQEQLDKATTIDEQEQNVDEFIESQKINDKAKLALIKDRIASENKRKAIVHKMEVDEMPYSQNLVDMAEDGDKVAQERVETERENVKEQMKGSEEVLNINTLGDDEDIINEKSEEQKRKEREIEEAIAKHKKEKEEQRQAEEQEQQKEQTVETAEEESNDEEPQEKQQEQSVEEPVQQTTEEPVEESKEDPVISEQEAEQLEVIVDQQQEVDIDVPEIQQDAIIEEQQEDDQSVIDRINNSENEQIQAINDTVTDMDMSEEENAMERALEKIDKSEENEQRAQDQADEIINEDYVQQIEDIIQKLDAPEEDIEIDLAILHDHGFDITENKKILDSIKDKQTDEQIHDDAVSVDMVSKTMFYQPESTNPMYISVDGKPVNLPYDLKSGKELASQLEKKGWINSKGVKKYYIVTRDKTQTNQKEGNDPNDYRGYSVILIIQDDNAKACYATAMRRTGKHYYKKEDSSLIVERDFYKEEEARLLLKGTVKGTTMAKVKSKTLDIMSTYYDNYKKTHARPKYKTADQYREYIEKENPTLYYQIEYQAREFFAKPNSRILTRQQIREQLAILDANRKEIIDAYLSKDENGNYVFPETPKFDKVHPKVVKTSNGSIKNNKTSLGLPVYRKIVNGTVDQIQKLFNSKKLVFGLGLGIRGSEPFRIRGLNKSNDGLSLGSTASDIFNGIGFSGKIYMMFESNNGTKVPIMLSERKFNEQQDSSGRTYYLNNTYKPKLVFDGAGNVIDDNFKPSPAEVLLYLICKRNIGNTNYGLSNDDLEFLKNLFINEGEHTLVDQRDGREIYNIMGSKQLYFDGEFLHVGIKKPNNIIDYNKYRVSDLFNNSEISVQNRQEIVEHISNNLHFNTDETTMSKQFSDSFINSIIGYMNENDIDEVDLFGCPYMKFKREDLVHKEGNRQMNNHMTGAAWMIATEKLRTDTDERVLVDPFLYASGIKESEKSQVKEKIEQTKGAEITKGVIVTREQKVNTDMQGRFGNIKAKFKQFFKFGSSSETTILEGEEKKKHLKDTFFEQDVYEHIILDMSTIEDYKSIKNVEDFIKQIDAKLNSPEVKNYLNNLHGINDYVIQYTSTKDLLNKCKERTGRFSAQKAAEQLIPEVIVKKEGEKYIAEVRFVKPANASNSAIRAGVTGVFSKSPGRGKLNKYETRKWFQENLGLRPEQVLLTDSMLKSMYNEEVYAVTNVAVDMLNNPFVYTIINSQYGEGLQYHEAWHYVNLLLHNKAVRAKLYQNYKDTHPGLINAKVKEVEEMMADDFKRYMELKTAKGLTGVIRRLFDDVKTFIKTIGRNKPTYRKIFAAISTGKYATVPIDKESLAEFKKRYKNGVYASFSVPNMKSKVIDKLGDITYQSFYQIGSAINEQMLNDYDINTEDDLMEFINSKNLGTKIKESIDSLIQVNSGNEGAQKILRMFKDSDDLLLYLQKQTWSKYGIKIKTHKKRNETPDTSAKLKEAEQEDNIWDRIDATVSRKDNAATATKLFFSRIPKYKGTLDENGERIFEREYTEYNVAKVYTQGEAWTNILSNLYNCDSYGELDESGEYKSNSLMGIVTRLSKSNAFFKSLLDKLNSIEDNVQLKSQIFATCNSSKIQVMFTNIFAREVSDNTSVDDLFEAIENGGMDSVYDQQSRQMLDPKKNFSLYMDNTVQAMNQTPRIWSKNVVCLGMLDADGSISKVFVDNVSKRLSDIRKQFNKLENSRKSDSEKRLALNEIKFDLIDLYNVLGIDVDLEVLDLYINMQDAIENKENPSIGEEIRAIQTIISTTTKGNAGSLENIVSVLKHNQQLNKKDKTTIGTLRFDYKNKRNNKVRPVDQLYNNYREDKLGNLSQMQMLAKAHNIVHPSSSEFSVTGPNGDRLYPIGQNNMITDSVRWLDSSVERIDHMLLTPYNAHSVILNEASTNLHRDGDGMFELLYNAGIKDSNKQQGEDYMSMTPIEDYVQKIELTQRGYFVLPTMADKKTWYCIRQKRGRDNGIQDFMLSGYMQEDKNNALKLIFKQQVDKLFERIDIDQLGNESLNDIISYLKKYNDGEVGIKILEDNFKDKEKPIVEILDELDMNYEKYEDSFIRSVNVNSNINSYAIQLAKKASSKHAEYKRFSDNTLNIFANYFLDEIDSLLKYYSEENIKFLIENPNKRIDNFDGNVKFDDKTKQYKLQFGGNGGKFRYFQDINNHLGITGVNLNQLLQVLFELQKEIENGEALDADYLENQSTIIKYISSTFIDSIKNNENTQTDGFELIRDFLKNLKNEYFINTKNGCVLRVDDNGISSLRTQLNNILINRVEDELEVLLGNNIRSKVLHMIDFSNGLIQNLAIPEYLFEGKKKELREKYKNQSEQWYTHNAIYMTIANHVVNNIQSVLEFEKIFAGDPAYYSWKPAKGEGGKKTVTVQVPVGNQIATIQTTVDNLVDRSSDKIKRLGSLLSPGEEIKTDYTENELDDLGRILACKIYTNINMSDVKATSLYEDSIKRKFRIQLLYDYFVNTDNKEFDELLKKEQESRSGEKRRFTKFNLLDQMYNIKNLDEINDKKRNVYQELWNLLDDATKKDLESQLEKSIGAFVDEEINVADAQVMVRPEMYRKIRIGLGQWSTEPDINGYSDELAYSIITGYSGGKLMSNKDYLDFLTEFLVDAEGNINEEEIEQFKRDFKDNPESAWLHNHKLAAIVSKFEMFPLKMSYFQNEYQQVDDRTIPMLNKMAIFPWFRHNATSETGRRLYDRMNREGQELDMISFESAVKVGATQNKAKLVNKGTEVEKQTTTLSDILEYESDINIDYETGKTENRTVEDSNKTLAVRVQQVNCLRMQLNTEAHHDNMRNLGTQMFKLAFSNIVDEVLYGSDPSMRGQRNGHRVKNDIMAYVDELTSRGYDNLLKQFFRESGDKMVIDNGKVRRYIKEIVKNNNMGAYAEEVIENGGSAACLPSRRLFENSVSAKVNANVINIETQGGTAVQQSVFGFFAHGNEDVAPWRASKYANYNRGEELKWDSENGSMQVMISIKFFKEVVPEEYQKCYADMRQWLIDNDIICGLKSAKYWKLSEEQYNLRQLLDSNLKDLDLSVRLLEVLEEHNIYTIRDLINNKDFYDKYLGEKLQTEALDILEALNLSFDTNTEIESKKVYSKPKPFGLGYRIPTQGMSSIFVMQVADVLPAESGDLIVVPREFTAQTGSDFDVDKLFLSTLHYNVNNEDNTSTLYNLDWEKANKMNRTELDKYLSEQPIEAIQNALLMSYMDVVGDKHNAMQSRGSIDTTTGIIKHDILPAVQKKEARYAKSFEELTPSFQSFRKQEFSAGKTGIGAFALNVTNMTLVQYVGLSMDFTKVSDFELKPLYSTHGKDGLLISNWLSAMINAMVDVAKDPYVFDINVVNETYNMSNFLIRTGNGGATFTFLAQPAIKEFISKIASGKGLYGNNLSNNQKTEYKKQSARNIQIQYLNQALAAANQCVREKIEIPENIKNLLVYWNTKLNSKSKEEKEKASKPSNKLHDILNQNECIKYLNVLNAPASERNKYSALDRLDALISQVQAVDAYLSLEPYADAMSKLVLSSRIDTEKFGNNIPEQMMFKNQLDLFIYKDQGSVTWTLKNEKPLENKWKKGTTEYNACIAYNNQRALSKYFNSTYLMDKFTKAHRMNKQINQHQLIDATEAFNKVFSNYLSVISGIVEYNPVVLKDGVPTFTSENPINTFDGSKIRKDTAIDVANAIESIIQFKILMSEGPRLMSRYTNYSEENATGPIDFTCGGDIDAVVKKMADLSTSDNTIVDRLLNLKKEIQQIARMEDPTPEQYSMIIGLVDENGNITNDLLSYIVGVKANAQVPIDHIILETSAMDIDVDEKNVLYSAFGQLLEHENIEIRKFARDLAFYAYHSQYNQNTTNSFFDLIPGEFSKQYTQAITLAMHNHRQLYRAISSGIEVSDALDELTGKELFEAKLNTQGGIVDNFIDIIARNYYKNNNVVPLSKTKGSKSLNANQVFTLVKGTGSHEATMRGEDIFLTNKEIGGFYSTEDDAPYVKIVKNGNYRLYKKVAIIKRTKHEKGKNPVELTPINLYVRVPLAGVNTHSIKLLELYADFGTMSVFNFDKKSKISNKLRPQNAIDYVLNNAKLQIESNQKKEDGNNGVVFEFIEELEIPSIYTQSNEDLYFTKAQHKKFSDASNNLGTNESGTVYYEKRSSDAMTQQGVLGKGKPADIIIDLNNDQHVKSEAYSNKAHTVTNDDISSNNVIQSMLAKLQSSGVFETDVVTNELKKLTDVSYGIMKNSTGARVSICGEFEGVTDINQAINLSRKLIQQLIFGGIDIRQIRYEGGSITSIALSKAIDEYAELMYGTTISDEPIASVFFNGTKLTDAQIKEEISAVANDNETLEKEDVIQQEQLEAVVQNRDNLRQSLIDAYDILKNKAKQKEQIEAEKEKELNAIMAKADDILGASDDGSALFALMGIDPINNEHKKDEKNHEGCSE